MNLGLELHDSTVTRAAKVGEILRIALQAIVHESWGMPGTDPGEVWLQSAEIVFTGVKEHFSDGELAKLQGQRLTNGTLTIGSRVEHNVLPLPINHTDSPQLTLEFESASLRIGGQTIRIELSSAREHLEAFG